MLPELEPEPDDRYFCSSETKAKINAFIDKWPGSSYGPAHIVLDDDNLDDDDILFCIKNCQKWIKNNEGNKEEIEATIIFLLELLRIPEDDR